MAQAVKRLFPDVKLAIGPAIEDGFYYDFAKAEPFTPEDLVRIEAVMREIAKTDYPFERRSSPARTPSPSSASAASLTRSRSSRASTPRACRSTARGNSSTSAAGRTSARRAR